MRQPSRCCLLAAGEAREMLLVDSVHMLLLDYCYTNCFLHLASILPLLLPVSVLVLVSRLSVGL